MTNRDGFRGLNDPAGAKSPYVNQKGPQPNGGSGGAAVVLPRLFVDDSDFQLYVGDVRDVLRDLPAESAHCVVTSPPYWGLRDYGTGVWDGGDPGCDHRHETEHQKQGATSQRAGRSNIEEQRNENYRDVCGKCGATRVDQQLGLEATPDLYVAAMVDVFREVRRVMRRDATLWLNLGDAFMDKQMQGMPWRVAFALQADGWYLRSAITWCKLNAMPESVTDRPTKATEMVFLLAKNARYYYDAEALREPHKHDGRSVTTVVGQDGSLQHRNGERWPGSGANARDWWPIATQPFSARALGGDNGRTTSPDCPVHGSRRQQASAVHGDAPQAAFDPPHTPSSDDRPALEPLAVPAATALGQDGDLERSSSATGHSSGTSRTDAPSEPRDTAAAPLAADTVYTPEPPALFSTSDHTRENRTAADSGGGATDSDPSAQTTSHTARNPCTCKYIDHFAVFPEELARRCILAGCPEGGTVLDPFIGSGTTALVARKHGRHTIGIELNPDYAALAARRLQQLSLLA